MEGSAEVVARMKSSVVAAVAIAALLVMFPAAAIADGSRVTQGDAQAVFESFGNGGWAILNQADVVQGAPADGGFTGLATIRPFNQWNGHHYCALDWHTLVFADIEGGDAEFQQTDAQAIIAAVAVAFTLDGTSVATSQTAVKAFLNPERFGLTTAYYAQFGRVMAPSELTVGAHVIGVVQTFAGRTIYKNKISIVVDAPGTGACG
jgi:hypothetical protein